MYNVLATKKKSPAINELAAETNDELTTSWNKKQDTSLENAVMDDIIVGGIYSQGFGVLPRYAMFDKDLTLTSKSIYALLCSFSGQGNVAFPGKKTILEKLRINEETYYKHRKILIENGYISIFKEKTADRPYPHNVFLLEANPKKFQIDFSKASEGKGKIYSKISYQGLKSMGYGLIAKLVMFDEKLTANDKGVYAYFAAYAGAGNVAFPKLSKILEDLQISHPTYYKSLKNIKNRGYIKVVQRNDSVYDVNDYYIIDNPAEELKSSQASDVNLPCENLPCENLPSESSPSENLPSENLPSENLPSESSPSENIKGTIRSNLSAKSNLSVNNNLIHKDKYDGYRRVDFAELIKENIAAEEIPIMYPNISSSMVNNIVNIMAACCMNPSNIIGKSEKSREEVADVYLSLTMDHVVYVIDSVRNHKKEIKNIRAYYAAALFNSIETMELYYDKLLNE